MNNEEAIAFLVLPIIFIFLIISSISFTLEMYDSKLLGLWRNKIWNFRIQINAACA